MNESIYFYAETNNWLWTCSLRRQWRGKKRGEENRTLQPACSSLLKAFLFALLFQTLQRSVWSWLRSFTTRFWRMSWLRKWSGCKAKTWVYVAAFVIKSCCYHCVTKHIRASLVLNDSLRNVDSVKWWKQRLYFKGLLVANAVYPSGVVLWPPSSDWLVPLLPPLDPWPPWPCC